MTYSMVYIDIYILFYKIFPEFIYRNTLIINKIFYFLILLYLLIKIYYIYKCNWNYKSRLTWIYNAVFTSDLQRLNKGDGVSENMLFYWDILIISCQDSFIWYYSMVVTKLLASQRKEYTLQESKNKQLHLFIDNYTFFFVRLRFNKKYNYKVPTLEIKLIIRLHN